MTKTKPTWRASAQNAWRKHVVPAMNPPKNWMDDSRDISDVIRLSKRELFGLIILSIAAGQDGKPWGVGYDPNLEEPNDGQICKGKQIIRVEHKIIWSGEKKEVLSAILDTYQKAKDKRKGYGNGRLLLIHPNKNPDHGPGGLIKISDLTHKINNFSPFDQVISLGLVTHRDEQKRIGVFHLHRHHPKISQTQSSGPGIIAVTFDYATGLGKAEHVGFDMLGPHT